MTDTLGTENDELVRAYRLAFGSPAGQVVLIDLMKFCRFRADAEGKIDEGKRRAFLRIMNFMALTPEQLESLYRGQRSTTPAGADDNE